VDLKRWHPTTTLHGVTTRKTSIGIPAAFACDRTYRRLRRKLKFYKSGVFGSRDSSASIVTRLPVRRQGFDFGEGKELDFIFATASTPALSPPNWYRSLFYSGLKRPGLEADYSPPSVAEVTILQVFSVLPGTSVY
jgi:hypothetical protein